MRTHTVPNKVFIGSIKVARSHCHAHYQLNCEFVSAHGAKLRRTQLHSTMCLSQRSPSPPVHHNAPLRRRFIRQNRARMQQIRDRHLARLPWQTSPSTNHSPMFLSCRMCPLRWIFQSFMTAARFMFGSHGVCTVTQFFLSHCQLLFRLYRLPLFPVESHH